jgi:hypothetical protein
MVASGVDFLTGIAAEGEALLVGLLFGSGEEALVAAGELEGFGAGVDFFSVVTDTLGSVVSDFRETDASGEASGAGMDSSWARAS